MEKHFQGDDEKDKGRVKVSTVINTRQQQIFPNHEIYISMIDLKWLYFISPDNKF